MHHATTHGDSAAGNKLYRTWVNMRQRCNNPNHQYYADYGGRGVEVCPEWESYEPFKEWALAHGYVEGLTLDREGNGLLYSPEHCRWVDRTAQQRNRRGQKGSSSQYVGVSKHSRSGSWQASIKIAGKAKNLGQYPTELEAAWARENYIIKEGLTDFTKNFSEGHA